MSTTQNIQIRAIADGELLDELDNVTEGDEYDELRLMTWAMRSKHQGRENITVQLIRDGNVEAENIVNPAPALS